MKVAVYAVGRLKEDYLVAAEAEYKKRLRPLCKFETREFASEAKLLAAVPDRALLIALDERGESLSSQQFARDVVGHQQMHGGGADLVFAIGGADGHSDALRKRAARLLSFGRATMAHRLVRIVLVEQIYRAFSILRGTKYHRE